jgi:hypothetical protein
VTGSDLSPPEPDSLLEEPSHSIPPGRELTHPVGNSESDPSEWAPMP